MHSIVYIITIVYDFGSFEESWLDYIIQKVCNIFAAKSEGGFCLLVIFWESTIFFYWHAIKNKRPHCFYTLQKCTISRLWPLSRFAMVLYCRRGGKRQKIPPPVPTTICSDTTAFGYNNIIMQWYSRYSGSLEHHPAFPDLHPLDFRSCNYIRRRW